MCLVYLLFGDESFGFIDTVVISLRNTNSIQKMV